MMVNIGDEDGSYSMSRHHRNILNRCRTYLIRNLDVKPVVDEFVTSGLLSPHQEEALMVYRTNTELVRNFCNSITRLGPTAFVDFLNALTATNQDHIRKYIESIETESDSASARHLPEPEIHTMMEESGDSSAMDHLPVKGVDDFVIPNHTKDKKSGLENYTIRGGQNVKVLIINNEVFSGTKFNKRDGSVQDVNNLCDLFSKFLNFNVKVNRDLKAADLRLCVTQFSREECEKETDACIVVIMSHGDNGVIYGTDGERISIREVMEIFSAEHCRSLIDKPKYFIFQSCRGEDKETGIDSADGPSSERAAASMTIDEHPLATDSRSDNEKYIPNMVDTMVSYATLPGYVSWRNCEKGSWFVQALCSIFKENAAKHHLMEMVTMVTNKLVKDYGRSFVQLCEHTTRLRRNFYLATSKT